MALRQYRPDLYEETHPKERESSYSSYRGRPSQTNRIREVMFFTHIAIFSILTVFATYSYLSLSIPALLALTFGIGTSLVALHLTRVLIKYRIRTYRQNHKRP